MSVVYRRANQMPALAAAYAAASAARPRDASLLRGVFTNHVRYKHCMFNKVSQSTDEQQPFFSCQSHQCQWHRPLQKQKAGCCSRHVGRVLPCCRNFDFAGQQQQAMKLHKLAGSRDEHYIWWSIVSIVLQARAASHGEHGLAPVCPFSCFCCTSVRHGCTSLHLCIHWRFCL